MATESIQVSGVIYASPDRIYQAWLDEGEHSGMTGSRASIEPGVGGQFTAWDGYIRGVTLEVEPARRIVQRWRSNEFPAESPDSRLEVLLEPVEGGTRVTILHSDVPEGQGSQLEQGWRSFYLEPMTKYFSSESSNGSAHNSEPGMGETRPSPASRKPPKAAARARKAKAAPRKAKPAVRRAKKTAKKAQKALRKVGGRKKAGRATSRRKVSARKGKAKRRPVRRLAKKTRRTASRRARR